MTKLITFSALMLTAGAAMARVDLPAPDVLPLLGIGVLAAFVAAKKSKK